MDKLLQRVLEDTVRLCESSQQWEYEEFVNLTDLRQTLVEEVEKKGPLTLEQKKLMQEILKCETEIVRRMQKLKDEAEEGLRRLDASKKQKTAYGNASVHNSFMFDKRN